MFAQQSHTLMMMICRKTETQYQKRTPALQCPRIADKLQEQHKHGAAIQPSRRYATCD
jgi:hypothetical protein